MKFTPKRSWERAMGVQGRGGILAVTRDLVHFWTLVMWKTGSTCRQTRRNTRWSEEELVDFIVLSERKKYSIREHIPLSRGLLRSRPRIQPMSHSLCMLTCFAFGICYILNSPLLPTKKGHLLLWLLASILTDLSSQCGRFIALERGLLSIEQPIKKGKQKGVSCGLIE